MAKDAFQAYIDANERFYQAHDRTVANLEELVQTQNKFIEFLRQQVADDEKEIEQQRVTIQELQTKLAGATL